MNNNSMNSNGAQIRMNEILTSDLKSKSIPELIKLLADIIRAYGVQILQEFGKITIDLMLEKVKKTPRDRAVLLEAIKDLREMVSGSNGNIKKENIPTSLLKNANSIALVIDARDFGINVNQLKQMLMNVPSTNNNTPNNNTPSTSNANLKAEVVNSNNKIETLNYRSRYY